MFGMGLAHRNGSDIANEGEYAVHVVFTSYANGAEYIEPQIATLKPIES